jgi:hypothetical protein
MPTIIKHPDTYKCNICQFEHTRLLVAEICETNNPPALYAFNVGDEILVPTRYNGWCGDTITDISLDVDRLAIDYNDRSDNRVKKELTDPLFLQTLKPHIWVLTTARNHTVCNDGSRSNMWAETEVLSTSGLEWISDPTDVPVWWLRKYTIDDEVFIVEGRDAVYAEGHRKLKFDSLYAEIPGAEGQ